MNRNRSTRTQPCPCCSVKYLPFHNCYWRNLNSEVPRLIIKKYLPPPHGTPTTVILLFNGREIIVTDFPILWHSLSSGRSGARGDPEFVHIAGVSSSRSQKTLRSVSSWGILTLFQGMWLEYFNLYCFRTILIVIAKPINNNIASCDISLWNISSCIKGGKWIFGPKVVKSGESKRLHN